MRKWMFIAAILCLNTVEAQRLYSEVHYSLLQMTFEYHQAKLRDKCTLTLFAEQQNYQEQELLQERWCKNASIPIFDGLIPIFAVSIQNRLHRTKNQCTFAMVISKCNTMVLDPTVVSFAKAMQFILHGTNFPTASINKITIFE